MRATPGSLALGLALLFVPLTASAYTLVLRNGSRLEIGSTYQLNGDRIEFRGADGFVRAMSLGDVDVDATAHANRESVVAFIDRATQTPVTAVIPAPAAATQPAARPPADEYSGAPITITSRDLEPLRVAREQADAAYSSLHPNAGRPDPADEVPALGPEFTQDEELRWRNQAQELREQLDIEQSQIDAIRAELTVRQDNPLDYRLSYRYNYGNAPVFVQPNGRFTAPYGSPSGYLRADEEYAQLNSRLIDLEIQHRGSLSLWDNFVERARRRGVPPGWLRE